MARKPQCCRGLRQKTAERTPCAQDRTTARIKGIQHSKRSEKAGGLIVWGVIVAVFSILSIVLNSINGDDFSIISVLTGVVVPALYIYGAALNAKADTPYNT